MLGYADVRLTARMAWLVQFEIVLRSRACKQARCINT